MEQTEQEVKQKYWLSKNGDISIRVLFLNINKKKKTQSNLGKKRK